MYLAFSNFSGTLKGFQGLFRDTFKGAMGLYTFTGVLGLYTDA